MTDDPTRNHHGGQGAPTLRDQALAAVRPDLHATMLTAAADLGVTHNQDATWLILSHGMAAVSAATAAGEAAEKATAEIVKIPELVYRGATQAAKDVAGQVAKAGEKIRQDWETRGIDLAKAVVIAIDEASKIGAQAITNAAAGLDGVAKERCDAMIREWQTALANAVAVQARASLIGKLARSWGLIAGMIFAAGIAGAAATLMAARLTGHLTPWAIRLATTVSGRPNCGMLAARNGRDYRVCLAR